MTGMFGRCTKRKHTQTFDSFYWPWHQFWFVLEKGRYFYLHSVCLTMKSIFLLLLSISRWVWSLVIVWPLFLFSSLLVSMAPLSHEIRPVTSCFPPHFGPAVPEVNSVWFKLFIYDQVKSGPPSLLLVKGTRLRWLPKIFEVTAVFQEKIYLGLQKALRDFVRRRF